MIDHTGFTDNLFFLSVISQNKKNLHSVVSQDIDEFDNSNNLIVSDLKQLNIDLTQILQFNYSYDSVNIQFNFFYANIEHKLIRRFLRNKPKINLATIFVFEFSDELADSPSVFKLLNQTCEQEALTSINQTIEIMAEFNQVAELSDALNTLKIIINYVLTTAPDRDLDLVTFLESFFFQESILKNSKSVLKNKVQLDLSNY